MPAQPARQRGLTLPELALILLVIVACAVVLAPVMAKGGERKMRTNCAGHLKEIGLAQMLYHGDSGGFLALTASGTNLEPLNIWKLAPDGPVYACPSASVQRSLCAFSNYRYRGSGLKDDNDSGSAVSVYYDQSGNHPGNQWMNAGFIDGHVEGAPPDGSKKWNLSD